MTEKDRQEITNERLRQAVERRDEEARVRSEEESLAEADRPPETLSVRAKSSGHRKRTADKWNQ